jgi:hypothetical protein
MSFANLSLVPFLIGLAAIAVVLGLLQLLRVRYQRVDVVTTMFWREAIEESRARVLVKRFRHPWAYALVLAIAGLLWLAFAEPTSPNSDGQNHVVLLDGSAAMLAGDRYERTVESLIDQIERLPKGERQVFWCGGDARLLLDRGEETLLLSERLRDRSPEVSLSSVESFLLANLRETTEPTTVYVFGAADVSADALALLPETVTLNRVRSWSEADDGLNNSGIVAVGVSEAASGRYDFVNLYVRGAAFGAAPKVELSLEPMEAVATELGPLEWVFRDLPADGSTIKVRLSGDQDDLLADDEASFVLPLREPIRVSVTESLQPLLNPILAIDPAVVIVDDAPDVVFGQGDTAIPGFQLVVRGEQEEAFVLTDQWPDARTQSAVESTFRELGLDQIDATRLATELETTIRLGAETSDVRQVRVWTDVLSADYNLVQSSAFPLFIAKSVRWLADTPDLVPYLAVGEMSESLEIAGVNFAPTRPGDYETSTGQPISASLSSVAGAPISDDLPSVLKIDALDKEAPWMTWLVLLVLLLLLAEWSFFQKGWMP